MAKTIVPEIVGCHLANHGGATRTPNKIFAEEHDLGVPNGIDDHAADSKDGRLCGSLRCGPRRGLRRKRESKKKQNLQEVQRKHGSVSHLQQLKLDFFLLIRTNRQVASMRKVSAHGFRIP